MKEILGIIPARGGSKRVSGKNVKPLNGKPLIEYTIEAAQKSKNITRLIVSSDDDKIIQVAEKNKVEVINRPSEIAQDDSSSADAVKHSLEVLKKADYVPELVVLLPPTSPLRTSEDIDRAIELSIENDNRNVVSAKKANPFWTVGKENDKFKPVIDWKYFKMRSQELPEAYSLNGAIYVITPKSLLSEETFFNENTLIYSMPEKRSIDIDEEIDFVIAEAVINENRE